MCFRKNKTDDLVESKQEQMNKLNLTAKEKYEYVIKARNFHYREFNVWSTYFSIIVGALFVAYYNLLKDHPLLAFVVSALGFIASLCWYLSAKGYAYWWNHWSKYLIYLENQDINTISSCGVYSTFFDPESACRKDCKKVEFDNGSKWNPLKGSNVSTSKVMMLLTLCITISWVFAIAAPIRKVIYVISDACKQADNACCQVFSMRETYVIGVVVIMLITGVFFLINKCESDMSNHYKPDL